MSHVCCILCWELLACTFEQQHHICWQVLHQTFLFASNTTYSLQPCDTSTLMQIQAMSDEYLLLAAATVHSVAMAYLKKHAPQVIDTGRRAGETWCQELLLELNLVRRKCTTQAGKLPADWEL
jgi:hypothetical protein